MSVPVVLRHLLAERDQRRCVYCLTTEENCGLQRIVGLTPCGRATVVTLQVNNPTVVHARRRWVSAGWHQPEV